MEIKTTMRYYFMSTRMAIVKQNKTKQKIKHLNKNKCWQGCEDFGALVHFWWACKMVQPLWKMVWWFLKKLNIELACNPAMPLLGIYPRKLKTGTQTNTYTWMFIAATFTIAKRWKQPKCPSMDEWINKIWYIHIMECYSAIRGNEVLTYDITWMNLRNIMTSERKQTQNVI